jgi:hypothetical protein
METYPPVIVPWILWLHASPLIAWDLVYSFVMEEKFVARGYHGGPLDDILEPFLGLELPNLKECIACILYHAGHCSTQWIRASSILLLLISRRGLEVRLPDSWTS